MSIKTQEQIEAMAKSIEADPPPQAEGMLAALFWVLGRIPGNIYPEIKGGVQ